MKRTIESLPLREKLIFKYVDSKDRKMVSIRLPQKLIEELESFSKETQFGKTELIQYAIEQLILSHRSNKK